MERNDAPELRPGEVRPDSDRGEMRIGFTVSCVAHGAIVALLAFGLPVTSNPRLAIDQVVPVNVVTLAEKPAAPKVEPPKPQPPKKPDPPKEEAKAEPPKPAPPPPPPPPEPPQAKPEPPKVEPPKVEPPKPPPPPKVVEKPKPPEPKKVEPPKPPPRPQIAKAEPKAKEPPKKPEPDPFESVLKSVEKLKPQQRPEITPPKATPQPAPRQQTALNFGEQITASELDAVKRQVEQCWNAPVGARDAQNLIVEIEIYANPDGTISQALPRQNLLSQTNQAYQSAISAALRAVLNPTCGGIGANARPLPLPREKYEQWKSFVLVFNMKEMLGM